MPEVLHRVQTVAPHVQLEISARTLDETWSGAPGKKPDFNDDNEYDLIIGPRALAIQEWERSIDCEEVPMMCVYDGKRMGIDTPISLNAYLSLPQVVPYFASRHKTMIDDGLAAINRKRKIIAITDDHTAMPFYLKRTDTIANFPLHAAQSLAEICDLSVSPLPFATTSYQMSIYWHAKDENDTGHRWLRELVGEIAHQIIASPAA